MAAMLRVSVGSLGDGDSDGSSWSGDDGGASRVQRVLSECMTLLRDEAVPLQAGGLQLLTTLIKEKLPGAARCLCTHAFARARVCLCLCVCVYIVSFLGMRARFWPCSVRAAAGRRLCGVADTPQRVGLVRVSGGGGCAVSNSGLLCRGALLTGCTATPPVSTSL
jgi:hypothetical protein